MENQNGDNALRSLLPTKKNTMKLFQVDAFTNEKFKGNPAGVCIVDLFPETAVMQNIALEMNLSETAFVEIATNQYNIRYFTPIVEVSLCGHATLASAHILYETGIVDKSLDFTFRDNETDLKISFHDSWIKMNFPIYSISKKPVTEELNYALGVNATEVYESENKWRVVRVDSEADVKNSAPRFENLRHNKFGETIAVTAKSDDPNFDFVVRVFCDPDSGIYEDPVTGSANCILVPYWNQQTNRTRFNSKQISKRSGVIKTELIDNKINIYGQAITVMIIELNK